MNLKCRSILHFEETGGFAIYFEDRTNILHQEKLVFGVSIDAFLNKITNC